MENQNNSQNSFTGEHDKDKKNEDAKKLFNTLKQPKSRRMAATEIGYPDQTFMVTQLIYDWLKEGKAAVIGTIKCTRSKRWVQSVTTDPDLFPIDLQLCLFD